MTLASLWLRLISAVISSCTSAARMPFTLFAAMHDPMPVPSISTPMSCSPRETEDATIAGIERVSEHWVTNTARGAVARGVAFSDEAGRLSREAARAVGADICAVDLLECPRRGLLVNEVNHSMEFRNSVAATGVDIPGVVAEHAMTLGACAGAAR